MLNLSHLTCIALKFCYLMKNKQLIYMFSIVACSFFFIPSAQAKDYITETIDLDSVKKLPVLRAMQIAHDIDYKEKPYLMDDLNDFVYHSVKRAIKSKLDFRYISQVIVIFATHNRQYKLGIELIEMTKKFVKPKKLEDKLLCEKYLGYLYNKIGSFGKSVELFEQGLAEAEEANLDDLQADFYHHLFSEYEYLANIDSAYLIEVQRLQKKCYQNAIRRHDPFSLAFLSLSQLTKDATIQEIEDQWKESIQWLKDKNLYEDHKAQDLNNQYLEELFRAGHYYEFIKQANVLFDSTEIYTSLGNCTQLAYAYLKTGQTKEAKNYAQFALELFEAYTDFSAKRHALIWLPSMLEDLGMYKEAFHYNQYQNDYMQHQVSNKGRLNSERERFDRELETEIAKAEDQKKRNRYLATGLILLAIVLAVIGLSVKTLRSKNQLIETTLDELEEVNLNLNQANKDLESFAYASAHDIKNPLGTISGFMQLIKIDDHSTLSGETQEYIEAIDSSIGNVSTLINSILRYAKLGNQKITPEEVDFDTIIKNVQMLLYRQIQESEAQIDVQAYLDRGMGETDLLQQLILNLVSNAIKYSRPGVPPLLKIRSYVDDQYMHIEFRDNGIGIPEENLAKIFSLFGRADNSQDYEGVGVGLAVCLKIAQLHHGQLLVQNNSEHGATFTLVLPLPKKEERPIDALTAFSPA